MPSAGWPSARWTCVLEARAPVGRPWITALPVGTDDRRGQMYIVMRQVAVTGYVHAWERRPGAPGEQEYDR